MTARAGTQDGDRLWIRCPYCGDSTTSPVKAHAFISVTTLSFYCFRCGESAQLPMDAIIEILDHPELYSSYFDSDLLTYQEDQLEKVKTQVIPGAGSARRSKLKRFHTVRDGKLYDVFEHLDQQGKFLGYTLRRNSEGEKEAFSYGQKGLGYIGRSFHEVKRPIYLVEGPYDVIDENYVCCFGLYSTKVLKMMKGYPVFLYPDGDVWVKQLNGRKLIEHILDRVKAAQLPVLGFFKLPNKLDPGDTTIETARFMTYGEVRANFGKEKALHHRRRSGRRR